MTLNRITQSMMMGRSYLTMQTVAGRLSKSQEHLTTGRVLNRPSDSPTETTSAMRIRSELADQRQFARNASDGIGWLGQTDATLTGMLGEVRRTRELAIQGVSPLTQNPAAREALAAEVEQLRESLITSANSSYLGRPVFGGLVSGTKAYDASGAFIGVAGAVSRAIGTDASVTVNVNGPAVFGPDGANLFDDLQGLADSLRAGDTAGIQTRMANLDTAQARLTSTLADVGTRYSRVERAVQTAENSVLDLTSSLSEIENVDIARAAIDLQMNEVAYQAALAATARLVQPSLADFLR